jgi:hypothetical protein
MKVSSWVKRGLVIGGLAATATTALVVTAGSASAVTIVEHTDTFEACHFEAGDIPGVDQAFPATCIFVHEPAGNLQVVARAQLPSRYSLTEPYHSTVDCSFNGVTSTGTIVATKSGKVVAVCTVPGGA